MKSNLYSIKITHTTVKMKNEITKNRNSVKKKNILAFGLSIPLTYLILHKYTTRQGKDLSTLMFSKHLPTQY